MIEYWRRWWWWRNRRRCRWWRWLWNRGRNRRRCRWWRWLWRNNRRRRNRNSWFFHRLFHRLFYWLVNRSRWWSSIFSSRRNRGRTGIERIVRITKSHAFFDCSHKTVFIIRNIVLCDGRINRLIWKWRWFCFFNTTMDSYFFLLCNTCEFFFNIQTL